MPCASAMDRERCLSIVRTPGGMGRHLLTTAGDDVRLWNADVALRVLGRIDTKAEALWWLIATGGYLVPCGVTIEETKFGLMITGVYSTTCGVVQNHTHRPLDVRVEPTGTIADFGPHNSGDRTCETP